MNELRANSKELCFSLTTTTAEKEKKRDNLESQDV